MQIGSLSHPPLTLPHHLIRPRLSTRSINHRQTTCLVWIKTKIRYDLLWTVLFLIQTASKLKISSFPSTVTPTKSAPMHKRGAKEVTQEKGCTTVRGTPGHTPTSFKSTLANTLTRTAQEKQQVLEVRLSLLCAPILHPPSKRRKAFESVLHMLCYRLVTL